MAEIDMFPARIRNALSHLGISSLSDLATIPVKKIRLLRGIGAKGAAEIQAAVEGAGLHFPPTPHPALAVAAGIRSGAVRHMSYSGLRALVEYIDLLESQILTEAAKPKESR